MTARSGWINNAVIVFLGLIIAVDSALFLHVRLQWLTPVKIQVFCIDLLGSTRVCGHPMASRRKAQGLGLIPRPNRGGPLDTLPRGVSFVERMSCYGTGCQRSSNNWVTG